MITPERIKELRAVIARATSGPFATDNYECAPGDLGLDRYGIFQIGEDDPALAYVGPWGEAEANAKLFSEAANSLPSCLDTIEAQAAKIVELEAENKALHGICKNINPLRYEAPSGDTRAQMRLNISKELYRSGDCVLVWANEGDLNINLFQKAAYEHIAARAVLTKGE